MHPVGVIPLRCPARPGILSSMAPHSSVDTVAEVIELRRQLIKATQRWALRMPIDAAATRELLGHALLRNHAHYLDAIPAYRRIAEQEGVGLDADITDLQRSLLLADDIFKNYDPRWLDDSDFCRMNGWLSELLDRRVEVDIAGAADIDAWLAGLAAAGIRVVYSSGTSGTFSFVPRDDATWRLFRVASKCYLAPLLLHDKIGSVGQRLAIRPAVRLLSPEAFARVSGSAGLSDFDAVFLDFDGGRTGNQALAQELAPLFRRTTFLYQACFSASLLRLAARGPRSEAEREQLAHLQAATLGNKGENHRRVLAALRQATADRQRVFVFGTPYQFKELCETIADSGQPVGLRAGSLALFGGGWKSFTGDRIPARNSWRRWRPASVSARSVFWKATR